MGKLDSILRLELFGSPEVLLGDKKLTGFITVKSRALLFYLAMKPGVHSRQTLAALLWPETTETKAAKNLRNILSNLRKLVGSHLEITRTTAAFKRDDLYFLDVEQFSALLERYRRGHKDIGDLATAVSLYTGDFLDGFHVSDAIEYEDWLVSEQEQLQQAFVATLYTLAIWHMEQGALVTALEHVGRLLALENLNEMGNQLKMVLLTQAGQRNAALQHYHAFYHQLEQQLGITPMVATSELFTAIQNDSFDFAAWLAESRNAPIAYLQMSPSKSSLPQQATTAVESKQRVDWGEIPEQVAVYGRHPHLQQLQQWICEERCRLVTLTGLGGVGKTAVAATLFRELAQPHQSQTTAPSTPPFDIIIWRSLINAPPLEEIMPDLLLTLSAQQISEIPTGMDAQQTLLLSLLKNQRCLLVLDNFETILGKGPNSGHYRSGYAAYGKLLQLIGTTDHQSCLLFTSRELPKKFVHMERASARVRHLALEGLLDAAGTELLRAHGLRSDNTKLAELVQRYSGNPLALKLVADTAQTLLAGDVDLLLEETAVFGDIRDVLEEQFSRLTPLEKQLLIWLAIEREPVTAHTLWQNLAIKPHKRHFFEALHVLKTRSLLQLVSSSTMQNKTEGQAFSLQNVVMEFTTSHLVEAVCDDILMGSTSTLQSYALLKAHSKEYIQDSQRRLLLQPVAQWLQHNLGKAGAIQKIRHLLAAVRAEAPLSPGYSGANLLHLLVALGEDLRGYDFSHLTIWQADLRSVVLQNVSFFGSDLQGAIFRDTFSLVINVAFSPDGQMLAAGTADGSITFWRLHEYQPHLIIQPDSGFYLAMAFSPDGQFLANSNNDRIIRLWDTNSGIEINQFDAHTGQIRALAFSVDGALLFSSSEDRTIGIWDVNNGQLLRTISTLDTFIMSLAVAPNSQILAGGDNHGTVRLWEIPTGTLLNNFSSGNIKKVWSLAFCPEGAVLASAGEDNAIHLWSIPNGKKIASLRQHTNFVLSIAFHPDGTTLASGSADTTIRLWDWRQERSLRVIHGSRNWITTVAFSPDGTILASGGYDRTIRLWQGSNGNLLHALRGSLKKINEVAFSPDGKLLATASFDQPVRLWDAENGRLLHLFQGHEGSVRRLVFSPDSAILAISGDDSNVRLWQTQSGRLQQTFSVDQRFVRTLAFSNNGRLLAIGAGLEHGTLYFGDIQSQHLHLRDKRVCTGLAAHISFSPDGQFLAYSTNEHALKLINIFNDTVCITQTDHQTPIGGIRFSPDSTYLVSQDRNGTVIVWQAGNDGLLTFCARFLGRGPIATFWNLVFSPDSRKIAFQIDPNSLGILDVTNGHLCCSIMESVNDEHCMAFSNDSTLLITNSSRGCLRLWDVETGACQRTLQEGIMGTIDIDSRNGRIASGGSDGLVRIWDIQTGSCVFSLKPSGPYDGLDVTGAEGLSSAQVATLKSLGAVTT